MLRFLRCLLFQACAAPFSLRTSAINYQPPTVTWLPLFFWLLSAVPLLAQPANDNFADRITLIGTNITFTASNVGATAEPGEPLHWGRAGGSSVWWAWKAQANGQAQIATDGSSFDTVLAVYVGSEVTNLSLLAGNDDHVGTNTSLVYFQTTQNTEYEIVVDGINGASGGIGL